MNGHSSNGLSQFRRPRFAEIPPSIDIPVSAGDDDEDDETAVVEVDPNALPDDPTELCTLLENENSPRRFWMHIALAYAKHSKIDTAIEIMSKGLQARASVADRHEKLPMLNCLTWLFLQRSREAGKNASGFAAAEAKTKESYLQLATQTLNESTRLDPSAAVNSLARGIYSIFKASSQNPNERNHHLELALKIFDDAIRNSRGGNMLALMGKARVLYARKRYDKALECYQEVLLKRPDMDPDPRIGIGMCFWMLGHKDDAKMAWERTLEIDPDSKVAHSLMAAYYLHVTSTMPEYDPSWMNNYRQVIDHTQKAYKLDKNFPMACATFASHFFSKKGYQQCESLAKKAIEYSDVPGITSDGWYILGRKAHAEGELSTALSCYRKSDQTREGGWLPAKIGVGQVQVLMKDIPSAKLTFEAIVQENPKCQEAKTILGTLYAHEVLSAVPRSGFAGSKDDITELHKKAIFLLEGVRNIWRNDKRTDPANEAVLLTLARLYEHDQPEKSLLCLQAVHQIYMEVKETDEDVLVPIQLLNNIATLYWHQEKYSKARELYQEALEAIPLHKEKDEHLDSDALATTLTYNLGRCEEAAGNFEQATKHYNQLLQFHDDYVDANMRLTYMALRNTSPEGPKMISKLMQTDGNNLEVRALNGWYLSKQKRKPLVNIAEDAEQRHYKHSLQHYDKHDRFSLTAMGNLYLHTAREMPRATESDKEKKRKTYEKAVEFFDKVLQLDPKNAYAAQGIAIAMIEDKKELRGAVGILTKVRETLANDGHAVVNLGHCLAGLEQWGRAIEMYETALSKHNQGRDPNILSCLGRVWYAKGKKESKMEKEKAFESMKNSLEYAKKALDIVKENPVFMFNVAFVQSELVSQILQLNENQRTVAGMEAAAKELDEAVQTFKTVAAHKTPPYPPKDIEARASMGRTTRNKLDRAIATQKEYEERNAAKLAEARKRREEDIKRRQAEMEEARRREEEKKAKVANERRRIIEQAREYAERKEAEERERDEREEGAKEGRRRKRTEGEGGTKGRRRRKKDFVDSDEELSGEERRGTRRSRSAAAVGEDGEEPKRPAKKRKKLTRGKAAMGNFKSSEMVHSSDDEDEEITRMETAIETEGVKRRKRVAVSDDEDDEMDDLFGDEDGDKAGDVEMQDQDAPAAATMADDDDDDE
ncbi:hypothetical protein FN846DRAFT_781426 [Sphaerosporella brunnea]|uniref:TPR-like protein n=1 Tax=Sphaerosporella brunnea TaxID=1250544 RepID=A0A5J5ESU3_9PEZI|nr:hypothetical protein FN846DRAFT_781426 [Sphaerosporella brunnea]